jgi:protein-S-isoprenylcysteine O-methyltransferase Ste14
MLAKVLGMVPIGGRTPSSAAFTLATLAALFVSDLLAVRITTGRWEQNPFQMAARDRTIVPIQLGTFAGFAVGLSAARIAPGLDMRGSPWIPTVIGLVVSIPGISIRVWAIVTLGRAFSRVVRVEQGQRVVTEGPYRFVRHPSYTGLLLAFTGIGLMVGNWLGVAALATLPTIAYVIRIFVEERTLQSEMGERYAEYARGRSRLLPGIW